VFNIGPTELIVIMLVALLVVGPKRLPEVGKTIGRSLREFRKAQDDLKSSFNFDLDQAEPEAPRRSTQDWVSPEAAGAEVDVAAETDNVPPVPDDGASLSGADDDHGPLPAPDDTDAE
jgi:TatA/E family protein of Tat protein translocase